MAGIRQIVLALAVALTLPAAAQAQDRPAIQSPILTIESDRLFAESAFGRRVASEIEADGAALAVENRQIEAELTEEERRLTEQRKTMEPAAFRKLADDFDERVQAIRRAQDAKARALGQRSEEARRRFLSTAQPVLESVMQEAGAAVVMERRGILLSADAIDVTDLAIARIDAAIGNGTQGEPAEDAPGAAPPDPQAPARPGPGRD